MIWLFGQNNLPKLKITTVNEYLASSFVFVTNFGCLILWGVNRDLGFFPLLAHMVWMEEAFGRQPAMLFVFDNIHPITPRIRTNIHTEIRKIFLKYLSIPSIVLTIAPMNPSGCTMTTVTEFPSTRYARCA